MCTGNVYCEEISPQAVTVIAAQLGILSELIEESAFIFEQSFDGTDWRQVITEQNAVANHPQTAYRQLLQSKHLWINESHHAISAAEYETMNRFSRS